MANKTVFKQLNGVVFPSGNDNYLTDREFNLTNYSGSQLSSKEQYYQKILKFADQYDLVTYGICLGNQQQGLYEGATLKRVGGSHSEETVLLEGTPIHFMALSEPEQSEALNQCILPKIIFDVVSLHSYSLVKNKTGKLSIGAMSKDGQSIEATFRGAFEKFGLQFHVETIYPNGARSNRKKTWRQRNLVDGIVGQMIRHAEFVQFAKENKLSRKQAIHLLRKASSLVLERLQQCKENPIKNATIKEWKAIQSKVFSWKEIDERVFSSEKRSENEKCYTKCPNKPWYFRKNDSYRYVSTK